MDDPPAGDRRRAEGRRARHWDRLWIVASLLVLLFPLRLWTSSAGRGVLSVPASPLARVNPLDGALWSFLEAAREHLPSGATFTVRAATREAEMDANMLAFALIRDATLLPSSYYGRPYPEVGSCAEYVLLFGLDPPTGERVERVAAVTGGTVVRRLGQRR